MRENMEGKVQMRVRINQLMHLHFITSPAKYEIIPPGCYLPRNLTGKWESSGTGEAQVVINSTHITETMWRGYAAKTTTYTCVEQRGNRYLMAKQSVEGW